MIPLDTSVLIDSLVSVLEFGMRDAEIAAELCRTVPRPRRELELAIAASALLRDAELWTLNLSDFTDIETLRLYSPPQTG